ncbi:paraquat-inducible protein A [Silvimonas iriomotensis]|uniref:Paraquat-inducible protein n=1 Tax=Silvimonas iriomotensis TaxID=449662 RepID=A0ABQ2P528_9NEIS|nr:paraquat-inducible protein A [Silvimonas iriomotensis]GGP18415.1 paraquat-inducible protein [Silvimonas iriomotensis]
MSHEHLIACHECDLLLRPPELEPGGVARCPRCGATLYKSAHRSQERALAFTVSAIILLMLANFFPIMALQVGGNQVSCTLTSAALMLYHEGMQELGILVLITTVIVPTAQMLIMLYVLLPLSLDYLPPRIPDMLRMLNMLRPWSMVEVFMLGILVSLTKLTAMATVIPGIALWSFAALMVLMTAAISAFNARHIWQLLPLENA